MFVSRVKSRIFVKIHLVPNSTDPDTQYYMELKSKGEDYNAVKSCQGSVLAVHIPESKVMEVQDFLDVVFVNRMVTYILIIQHPSGARTRL